MNWGEVTRRKVNSFVPHSIYGWPRDNCQRGSYAAEFALVFPVFFLVFYGILTFGFIFTAQQSLTLAAEDGARAAVRYNAPAAPDGMPSVMLQLKGRLAHGCDVVDNRISWLAQIVGAAGVQCGASVKGPCADGNGLPMTGSPPPQCTANFSGGAAPDAVACGYRPNEQCIATLRVAYGYRAHPIVPLVPLAGFAVPEALVGAATVMLDPAALQPGGGV